VATLTEALPAAVDLPCRLAARPAGQALARVRPRQPGDFEYRIFGDRGHITFDVNEGSAVIYGAAGEVHRLPGLSAEERYPDWAPADNLVDVVLDRGANGSPASLGVITVEFVDAMYRAAREGRAVKIGELESVG
jgi:predicted dehydrogenase